MNPDIGVNFLGDVRHGTHRSNASADGLADGISFEEAEIQFSADVDPYLKANALFSLSPSDGEYSFEPEEVYLETTSLPAVTLRAGKFKAAISRHNELHTHAYPFLDAPRIERELLGEEGLNQAGISASLLFPTPWFSELTAQVVSAGNEASFGSPNAGDTTQVGRLRNLWDLSEDATLEWNLGVAEGSNAWHRLSWVGATSLTGKWRPSVLGKYKAIVLHAEYLSGHREGAPEDPVLGGVATWVQYQFAQRWWIQARGEWTGVPASHTSAADERKQSLLLSFFPSEFSGFRAQYDHIASAGGHPNDHRIALQWNISIGAHPAHAY